MNRRLILVVAFSLVFSPALLADIPPDCVPGEFSLLGTGEGDVCITGTALEPGPNIVKGALRPDQQCPDQVPSRIRLTDHAGPPSSGSNVLDTEGLSGIEKTSSTSDFPTSVYSGMGWSFPALTLHQNCLYVNSVFDGLFTFRIGDDLTISPVDELPNSATDVLWRIDADDEYLFAPDGETLGIYDLSNPERPQLLQASYSPHPGAVDRVFLSDSYALMLMPSPLSTSPDSALQLVSFDDPLNAVVHSTIISQDYPGCAAIPSARPDLLIFGWMGKVYDISDPSQPVEIVESTPEFGSFRCWGDELVSFDGTLEESNYLIWDIHTDGSLETVHAFTGPMASSGFLEFETCGNLLAVMNASEIRLFIRTTDGVDELFSRPLGFYPASLAINEDFIAVTGTDTLLVVGLQDLDVPDSRPASVLTSRLLSCYPNPFNSATVIHVDLKHTGQVQISIYDILGRKITQLVDSRMETGHHSVTWSPNGLSSGTYMIRMTTNEMVQTRKVVYVK